jgi:hypothetical protein
MLPRRPCAASRQVIVEISGHSIFNDRKDVKSEKSYLGNLKVIAACDYQGRGQKFPPQAQDLCGSTEHVPRPRPCLYV